LSAERLGAPPEEVGRLLAAGGVVGVMEIVVRVGRDGRTAAGNRPLDVLKNNLPVLEALGCPVAHWHLVLREEMDEGAVSALEASLYGEMETAVAMAAASGIRFGLEHNNGNDPFFASAASIAAALHAVPALGFVCDLNHILPGAMDDFFALFPRCSMLHLSDTPLPAVNYHLPLGQGNLPLRKIGTALHHAAFSGVAILEIGGAPWSGGYGQDSDAALCHSRLLAVDALQNGSSDAW
jgi:L-ribulose-5-phosphate 3-epimerase